MQAENQAQPLPAGFAKIAADADALAAEMSGAPADGAAAPGQAADEPAAPTNAEVIADMLLMLKSLPLVAKHLPSVPPLITEDIARENGEAAGAFMDKYGYSFGGLERWAVEIRAAMTCGGFLLALGEAVNTDLAARRAAQIAAPAAADPAPAVVVGGEAAAVSFG